MRIANGKYNINRMDTESTLIDDFNAIIRQLGQLSAMVTSIDNLEIDPQTGLKGDVVIKFGSGSPYEMISVQPVIAKMVSEMNSSNFRYFEDIGAFGDEEEGEEEVIFVWPPSPVKQTNITCFTCGHGECEEEDGEDEYEDDDCDCDEDWDDAECEDADSLFDESEEEEYIEKKVTGCGRAGAEGREGNGPPPFAQALFDSINQAQERAAAMARAEAEADKYAERRRKSGHRPKEKSEADTLISMARTRHVQAEADDEPVGGVVAQAIIWRLKNILSDLESCCSIGTLTAVNKALTRTSVAIDNIRKGRLTVREAYSEEADLRALRNRFCCNFRTKR